MVGFGLGFGSRSMSRQYAALGQNVPLAALGPSALWNGTPGSGFAGSPPTDPVRTTAKPTCRLLVPPNQYFTDELVIGVWAGANSQGSMFEDLGLERVVAHCEGATFTIEAPSFYLFEDANGNQVRYFGWWAVLQHPGLNGHAHVYFEAVPKDPAMQSRVIGPFQFSPQASVHDAEISVEPSQAEITGMRYQTIAAALSFCRTAARNNPLITIREAGTYDLTSAGPVYSGQGYAVIQAEVPITIAKPGLLPGAASLFRTGYDGLWFRGANITFDFYQAGQIYHENIANRAHVFEGVNLVDSGGRYYTSLLGGNKLTGVSRNAAWFMECAIANIPNPCTSANLVRGCLLENGYYDAASGAPCVVDSTIRNWTSEEYRLEIPALTVQYTGAQASATLELSGGNDTSNRTFTAKVAGIVAGTFTVYTSEAEFAANTNYTVANVAAWLNSLPGWTATLLDNSRRAAALSIANNAGGAFGATNVKSAPQTLVTMFDAHGDLWQWLGSVENIVFANNLCHNNAVQSIFLGTTGGLRDAMVLNNVFDLDPADLDFGSLLSQLSGVQSHVVIAHNSLTNQEIVLRRDTSYDPDAFCMLVNNVCSSLRWLGSGTDADLVLRDNHLHAGSSIPAGSTGTTLGGNRATLFVDAAAGDFTPQGHLLGVLKNPALRYDRDGAARGVPALLGALAGPGSVAPVITSANPSGIYPENQPIGGNLVANKPVTWAVEGPDASGVSIDPVSGVWSLLQTDFEAKASYAFTFTATDDALDMVSQVVAITLSDLDEIAPLLSAPQATANGTSGATLGITTDEGNGTLHWFVSNSSSPPSAANLIAGIGAVAGGSQSVTAPGAYTASVSGLAAGSTYFAFFLHRDSQGNQSAIAPSASFTTSAAGGAASVVGSGVVLKSTATATTYNAASTFAFSGEAGRVLVVVAVLSQNSAQSVTSLTASVNGAAMTRISGASHSAGTARPICAVFIATGQTAGAKSISVSLPGSGRSCTLLAVEVAGLDNANLFANSVAVEGLSQSYSHSYTPTDAGNLVLSVLATRHGERGPFTPDADVIELQDDSTGANSGNDHSVFVGYRIATGTSASNMGATGLTGSDILFMVTELRHA